MDLVALLPWWAGVAAAVVSWLFFRSVANSPTPAVTSPGQVNTSLFLGVWFRGVSMALQYVVPFRAWLAR
ncbi:MAG TPA: hypothetical protein VF522_18305 [Ramlibacter sp.]